MRFQRIRTNSGLKKIYPGGVATADLEAQFEPTKQACLPEAAVWYPYEKTWQQIADGRLKGGLKKIEVALRYEDDFGIIGELAGFCHAVNVCLN